MLEDWNDIRIFSAVARTGSLSGAARDLGLTQPTISRRIADLEQSFGFPLFQRSQQGMTLTEAGHGIYERAEEMEACHLAIARQARSSRGELAGVVRVSASEGLASLWLTPRLAALAETHPEITVEVIVDNAPTDLQKRAADIALRLGRPSGDSLIARRVAELTSALFVGRSLVDRVGLARDRDELGRYRIVDFSWIDVRGSDGWRDLVQTHGDVALRTNSSLTQVAAIRAGLGVGLLPVYTAGLFDELVPVAPEIAWRKREIWLVAHRGVQQAPRMRLVYDYLVELLQTSRLWLSGDAPAEIAPAQITSAEVRGAVTPRSCTVTEPKV